MKDIWNNFLKAVKQNSSFKFKLGILCLLINVPIGWILGPILGFGLGGLFGPTAGGAVTVTFYALSWGMLGLGVLLAGKGGYQIFKKLIQDIKSQFFSKKQAT